MSINNSNSGVANATHELSVCKNLFDKHSALKRESKMKPFSKVSQTLLNSFTEFLKEGECLCSTCRTVCYAIIRDRESIKKKGDVPQPIDIYIQHEISKSRYRKDVLNPIKESTESRSNIVDVGMTFYGEDVVEEKRISGDENEQGKEPIDVAICSNENTHMQSEKDSLSIVYLIELIEKNKNEEFRSIVLNADLKNLINMGGKTLMHIAAATNNVTAITFLSVMGFDINSQNSLGQTALHLAVLNGKFQAVQLLLSLDADILVEDSEGTSTLQMCFQVESQVPDYIITNFLAKLKQTKLPAQEKANRLDRAGCSVYQVLIMNDAEVTGLILNRRTFISDEESSSLLDYAMNLNYYENISALLNYKPGLERRIQIFVEKVQSSPKKKLYLQQCLQGKIISPRYFVGDAFSTFKNRDMNDIQVYLDVDYDGFVRRELGLEIMAELFANRKINCLQIIENRIFNINGQSITSLSLLHNAVLFGNRPGVIYLLKNGANPNIKDSLGTTPISFCDKNDEIADLLLAAGADVQIINNNGNSVFSFPISERILAEICILEAQGDIKQVLTNDITKHTKMLKPHRKDLNWLKKQKVTQLYTLFTILADSVDNIARDVKNNDKVQKILKKSQKRASLQRIYTIMLTKKLDKALELHVLRAKAAAFLCNVMKIGQSDHLAIEKIVKFLSYKDSMIFRDENEL